MPRRCNTTCRFPKLRLRRAKPPPDWPASRPVWHGASVAVRCDGDGIVRTADDAPLFAVRGKTAFVSPAEACVERELGLRAVEAAGLELEERPVMRGELPGFDELFYVDHRGVTALAHCDGHPCMAILAERVAQSLGGLFPKM